MLVCVCFRADQMMIVAGDYKVNIFEGTEQYAKPHKLVIHPSYNSSTNNADIMLIKVLQRFSVLFSYLFKTACEHFLSSFSYQKTI